MGGSVTILPACNGFERCVVAHEITLIHEARIATVQLLEQLFRHIEETRDVVVRSRTLDELRIEDLTTSTFALFIRTDTQRAYRIARKMQRLGIEYGYYLDDNFWEIDPKLPIGKYYAMPTVRRRLAGILGGASVILVATPALRDYLSDYGDRVHVAESFVDFSYVPELPPVPPPRTVLRGGFASSRDRAADLAPMLDELLATLAARPDLEFEVVGANRGDLPEHPRIAWFPYLASYGDYIAFQRERQWDFGIAPLADNPGNLYKTDNKYREYAAQGIPGIYQDLLPYARVRDEETGLLVGPGRRRWREAIERYLDDAELRDRVRRSARADAERRLAVETVSHEWFDLVSTAPEAGARVVELGRVLKLNQRSVPAWLAGPKSLLEAAAVSLELDGLRSTFRRARRFGLRRVRARLGGSGRSASADRLEP